MMEAVKLLESRMYWKTEAKGFFPGLCFSNMWQLSGLDDMNQQVLDFINAVNVNLKGAMRACEVSCVDESMVKAFHRDLNGMMKIIHKPQSIASELKTVSNASTHTVLHMELHKPEEEWWIRNM